MQDFLQINEEIYDWQSIAISKIQKEVFGSNNSSIKLSPWDRNESKLVVVYGPPQIGKTTLILFLLGINTNFLYKDSSLNIYELLRGSSSYGNSSTSTAILYEQSDNDFFYIDGEIAETSEKVIELIDKIRKLVEENSFKKDMIHISIPKNAYYTNLKENVANIKYLDMPGVDSKNVLEIAHVDSIYKQYLSLATAILIVCDSNKIQSLSTLAESSRKKLSPHWELLNKYIIITVKSFSAASIVEDYFNKNHEANSFYNYINEKYSNLIHSQDLLPNCKSNIYSFDLGSSIESMRNSISENDYLEVVETNNLMANNLREEIKSLKGNGFHNLIKELKIIVEDDLNKDLDYIELMITKYNRMLLQRENNIAKNEKLKVNVISPEVEELEMQINALRKINNENCMKYCKDIFFDYTEQDFITEVENLLYGKNNNGKNCLSEVFTHFIIYNQKRMANEVFKTLERIQYFIESRISLHKISQNDNPNYNYFDYIELNKLNEIIRKNYQLEINISDFSKKERKDYLEKIKLKANWIENEILRLFSEDFQTLLFKEIERLEKQKELLEHDDSKLTGLSKVTKTSMDEIQEKLDIQILQKTLLINKRNELLGYLDNYKKVGIEVYNSCRNKIYDEINSCSDKNRKLMLSLYWGTKEDEYKKFMEEI